MAPRKRSDVDTETALMIVQEERNMERLKEEQQAERERLIAKSYEMAGQIKAVKMMSKFGDVTSLMWLKQVKESKIYRDLPGIGTWESYCNYLGIDRHTADQDLLNLVAFGEEFLVTVADLQVGYRDLRKLRQLTHDGTITIEGNTLEIAGESIPLDQDHKEDLKAAIEQILEETAEARKNLAANERVLSDKNKLLNKMEKKLARREHDLAERGLSDDEDTFLQQVENHRIAFDGYLLRIDPATTFTEFENVTPRMRAAHISALHYMKMQILAAYDTAVTLHGDPIMNPELLEDFDRWQQAALEP